MDKKTMKLLKQLISDAPEKIEAAKEAVRKEVVKSVKEGETFTTGGDND